MLDLKVQVYCSRLSLLPHLLDDGLMLWEDLDELLCGGEVHVGEIPSRRDGHPGEAEVTLLPLLDPLGEPHLHETRLKPSKDLFG